VSDFIRSGTLDNDVKGETGRGTIHWLEVTIDGATTRYEYGLLELLNGTFDYDNIVSRALSIIRDKLKEHESLMHDKKIEKLKDRKESVKLNQPVIEIISSIVGGNEKVVREFFDGKEKSLNYLLGLILKECKIKNIDCSAFDASIGLKQELESIKL
jgi:Asp-tRNA(Asn)/Glu-tRNA(Gln) amidotransferase B subunit